MRERLKIDISTSTIVKIALGILAIWFLYAVRDVIVLFFIVIVIVAALSPVVDKMSKVMPRVLAVIILALVLLGILVAMGFLIVPPLIIEIKQLAINLPLITAKIGPLYTTIQQSMANYQESLFSLSSQIGNFSSGIYSTTLGFISGIIAFFTILVLSFYMLLEQDSIKHFFTNLVPLERRESILQIVRKINMKMAQWLGGHLLLMLVVGILDGISLVALGVPYALVLAVWGGLVEIVPYIGPWLGLLPAIVIAFAISPLKGLLVAIAYIIIQQIESNILAPKILGRAVGLSPVIIILVLLIGAKLMGILGMIIAVPAAAAISILIQEWPEIRKLWQNA